MYNMLKRLAFAGLFLLPLAASPIMAQTPTPEGTVIKNKATASFTDANSNVYSNVSDSVSVTVGFLAAPSPTSPASVTPASPSTGDTLLVTLRNQGNGTDTMSVSTTVGAGVTITGYRITYNGGTTFFTYATQALLNAGLNAYSFPAGTTLPLQIVYDVSSTSGGATIPLTLTETSKRTPASFASTTTNINPPGTRAVAVTLDGATATQLPSATGYTYTFVVANNGNASDTYNLAAAIAGAPSGAVTITTVNAVAGTTGTVTVASGSTANVVVGYTVSNAVAAGSSDKITMTATSQGDATVKDPGDLTVTVTKAAVTISKTAWNDLKTVQLTPASLVKPGDFIQYKVTVTNGAAAAQASTVQVSDALPAEVNYVSNLPDLAGWTINQAAGTVTGSLATLNAGVSRFFWIRVQVK